MDDTDSPALRNSVDWRNRALAALLLVGLVVAFARLDVRAILAAVDATVLTYQEAAPVLTAVGGVLLVAVWIMVLIPSTVLELTLGYVFGLRLGFACVYLGKVAGCLGSFLLGRTVLRARCQRWFERHELFLAIDSVVAAAPYRICVLLRASYIPIAFKNYGFSVLSVPTRRLWSRCSASKSSTPSCSCSSAAPASTFCAPTTARRLRRRCSRARSPSVSPSSAASPRTSR